MEVIWAISARLFIQIVLDRVIIEKGLYLSEINSLQALCKNRWVIHIFADTALTISFVIHDWLVNNDSLSARIF